MKCPVVGEKHKGALFVCFPGRGGALIILGTAKIGVAGENANTLAQC